MSVLLLSSCTRAVSVPQADMYGSNYYTPTYSTGFTIRSLPGDESMLMLETYRPDTMQTIIPRGGFGSVAVMSSTYVGLLHAAGADGKIVAASSRQHITDNAVRERAVEIGYEGAMDYEALLSAKPEVALIYGIGGPSAIAAKLDELSVPYVYVGDFEETHPLGRAEWMVALGALCGTDAREIFSRVTEAYRPVAGNVAVMINAPYSGNWFIPGKESYMSRLIADAGGTLTIDLPHGSESKPVDMEQALPALSRADVWLSPGSADSSADLKTVVPKADFKGRVWNQNPDFYELGAAFPDSVLGELKLIFSGCEADTLHFFRRVQ